MKKSVNKFPKFKLAIIVVVLIIGGFLAVKSMMVSPQVALIANGGDEAATCTSNIATFTLSNTCGNGMANRIDYTCLQEEKKGYEGGAPGDCVDTALAYQHATAYCGQTCTAIVTQPSPSPQPSCVPNPCLNGAECKLIALPEGQRYCPIATSAPSLSPKPSIIPQPSISTGNWQAKCRVRAYKLNPSDDVTKSPMTYATIDREINHSSNRVKAGDSYAYLLEVSTLDAPSSIATISASTNNLHGFEEPFVIKSTSPNCQADSKSKFLSCAGRPGINLPKILNNTPTLLDLGMIVTIQPEIEKLYNTSFIINPYLISSVGNVIGASCTVMMLHESSTSTATPVPSTGPGCYTEQKFCIQSLIGQDCPITTICPSSTPTPTSTPIPSPVYSTKPSPVSSPISCGTSLNKRQFKESCGANMYRYVEFSCSGSSVNQVSGSSSSCKTESTWISYARTTCMQTQCASTPPKIASIAPAATVAPRPATAPSFAKCYNSCRANKSGALSCLRSCIRFR